MQLVDGLSLKQKLFILLALVISGLLVSGSIGYYNMYKMKKNLDGLYFGSYIPVTKLNKILNIYHKDIRGTFYQLKNEQIIPAEAAEKFSISRKKIEDSWKEYMFYFKRDYELSYLEYANAEVLSSTQYLKNLSKKITQLQDKDLKHLSAPTLFKAIAHIDEVINKIISYENEIAQYERKNIIATYHETIYQLLAILIFIISAAIMIMIPIFSSIKNTQDSLLYTSQKLQVVNKKLETASVTDALTKLYNRRYFNLVYNRELTRCIREGRSLAFMMLDIDYFKAYNDTYGHLQGDEALKAVSTAMNDTLKRPGDYLFRLGGEEFGILIVNIDEEKAHHMAEKIRLKVHALEIKHEGSEVSEFLSISIGLVVLQPDRSVDELAIVQYADENLYMAKDRGRNQVVMNEFLKEGTQEESS